jgi:hypothetical protein
MYGYQIVIFENSGSSATTLLRNAIETHLKEVGVDLGSVSFFDETTSNGRDRKSPTVAAYFGGDGAAKSTPELNSLLEDSVLVLPLVPTLVGYTSQVPAELKDINGFIWDGSSASVEAAVSILMEGLALLRKSRRVFISYLRKETSSVAVQLFEFLESRGFDVFLDTHSVRPAETFQEVLWHRLADSDVVIVLDSPNFSSSYWTSEEVSRAGLNQIQILRVLWPGKALTKPAALNEPFTLHPDSFQTTDQISPEARLTQEAEKEIGTAIESLRARALAARHDYLVREFISDADDEKIPTTYQPERFISLTKSDGTLIAAVPTVGVPDANRYHEVEELLDQSTSAHGEILLLYDSRGIMKRWIKHLSWLDQQKLKVRGLSIENASKTLKAMK